MLFITIYFWKQTLQGNHKSASRQALSQFSDTSSCSLLANGSAAFIWKPCCHWLKGLQKHHIIFVRQGSEHYLLHCHPHQTSISRRDTIPWTRHSQQYRSIHRSSPGSKQRWSDVRPKPDKLFPWGSQPHSIPGYIIWYSSKEVWFFCSVCLEIYGN